MDDGEGEVVDFIPSVGIYWVVDVEVVGRPSKVGFGEGEDGVFDVEGVGSVIFAENGEIMSKEKGVGYT